MKNSAIVAAAVLASGASAQFGIPTSTSTLSLLNSLTSLLTPSCRDTVQSLVQSNSSIAQCLNLEGLVPALTNNQTSIVPDINEYLTETCAEEACSPAVLRNATQQISQACAQDFGSFNIDPNVTAYFAEYYDTGRKILCLSSNETELLPNNTYAGNLTFAGNSSSVANSSEEVFCPVSLLSGFETYLGTPLTNRFIITTALGANSTAYRKIIDIPRNASVVRQFLCNDCVTAGLEIVLEDVPQLQNQTVFNLSTEQLNGFTGLNVTGNNTQWTLSEFYEGVCDVQVSQNGTLPESIQENASDNSTMTSTPATSSASIVATRSQISTSSANLPGTTVGPVVSASSVISAGATSVASAVATASAAVAPAARRRFVRWD